MIKALLGVFVALLLAGCGTTVVQGGAPALPSGLKEVRQVENITEYQLANGLVVLLAPDPSKPTATVNLTYRVGSRHEGNGETGAAHLLEHMLFKSSASIADPKLEMTRRGARWNGTTWLDRTNYFATFASDVETMDWMLGWLAESMTRAKLLQSEFDTELTVVRNELERSENNPSRVLGKRMTSAAYEWHGYRHDTLGARSDVEHIPLERLRAFYQRHYRPDNATLVIGGRFDAGVALAKVARAFGPIAQPAVPLPAGYTVEPPQDGERHVTLRRVGGNPSVAVLYHVMPGSARDFAAMRVLTQLLGMNGGTLDLALVRPGVGVGQSAYVYAMRDPGHLLASVGLPAGTPEAAVAQAQQALARAVETVQPTEAQVALARGLVLKSINDALRDPEQLSLGLSESIALGDWRLWFAMRDWIEAVTPADVQRMAATWLLASNRTSGSYLPTDTLPPRAPLAPPTDIAQALVDYRGKAAAAAVEDFALTPANIDAHTVLRRLTSGGEPGLRVALLPRPSKDQRITGTLRLPWGSADSLNGQQAPAGLAGPMLLRGTRGRTAEQLTADLLALDARLTINTGVAGLTANFELPAQQLAAFTALLGQILREPAFDAAEFQRVRQQQLAAVVSARTDTAALASNALQQVFAAPAQDEAGRAAGRYAPGDPRSARTHDETEAQLRAADAAQLRAFWQRFAGAAVGELVLIGPLAPDEVTAQWQQAIGDWKAPERRRGWVFAYPTDLDRLAPPAPIGVPDKANANYVARIPLAMNAEAPDYPALFAGVQLLGGRAGTALWQRVREQEGLSYGISASLFAPISSERFPGGDAAAINLTASFAPQNRERLLAAIRDELTRRAARGFSAIEVGFARRAIVSGRADALAQPANLAGTLATNLRHGRDMAHYARFTQAYETLDADAVNAALKKYLRPERMVEVTAGSFP
jgi:zinc protease